MLTLASILTTTALLSLAMAIVLGSLLRSSVPGVQEWFASNLMVVIALPLLALRDLIPDFISVVIANTVLALAAAYYFVGCARFVGQPPRWKLLISSIVLIALGLIIWRYAINSIPVRVLIMTTFFCTLCVSSSVVLLRHKPPHRNHYNYWFAAALALIFAACQLTRGIYFITLDEPSSTMMFDNFWNIVLMVIGAVTLPTMTMAAVMLTHDSMLATLEDAANHDHLTEAMSRKRLEAVAREQIMRAAKLARPLSLLIIDLDHFKRINDTFGHAGGDEVLREFARMTRASLRDGDALGRLGGEEFGILLPNTDTNGALAIARRLREDSERHLISGAFGECHYSISIGIATWRDGESFDRLSIRADRALYTAKNEGRNRVLVDEHNNLDSLTSAAA
ncbi:MAG: GGDEF domain-containing protein [Burkholderiaceae bacterium]|uniref:diguanylate cyclase n=1 Tax=Herminiimonas contaminans TaxID=1111140 RepID=A0ABS0EYV0_9BURK|nr:GGDEF domain-containing protein [Herminiimonas contaminans]MBF8178723.1 GGDEF domain-containing protein [Herminiimonas contaminans]MBX9799046.1 GGDEF domain-containing protein [Burkholderiaceae bacterium]